MLSDLLPPQGDGPLGERKKIILNETKYKIKGSFVEYKSVKGPQMDS